MQVKTIQELKDEMKEASQFTKEAIEELTKKFQSIKEKYMQDKKNLRASLKLLKDDNKSLITQQKKNNVKQPKQKQVRQKKAKKQVEIVQEIIEEPIVNLTEQQLNNLESIEEIEEIAEEELINEIIIDLPLLEEQVSEQIIQEQVSEQIIQEQEEIVEIPIVVKIEKKLEQVKNKLKQNLKEEGKSQDDPIFKQVLKERNQLKQKEAELLKNKNFLQKQFEIEQEIKKQQIVKEIVEEIIIELPLLEENQIEQIIELPIIKEQEIDFIEKNYEQQEFEEIVEEQQIIELPIINISKKNSIPNGQINLNKKQLNKIAEKTYYQEYYYYIETICHFCKTQQQCMDCNCNGRGNCFGVPTCDLCYYFQKMQCCPVQQHVLDHFDNEISQSDNNIGRNQCHFRINYLHEINYEDKCGQLLLTQFKNYQLQNLDYQIKQLCDQITDNNKNYLIFTWGGLYMQQYERKMKDQIDYYNKQQNIIQNICSKVIVEEQIDLTCYICMIDNQIDFKNCEKCKKLICNNCLENVKKYHGKCPYCRQSCELFSNNLYENQFIEDNFDIDDQNQRQFHLYWNFENSQRQEPLTYAQAIQQYLQFLNIDQNNNEIQQQQDQQQQLNDQEQYEQSQNEYNEMIRRAQSQAIQENELFYDNFHQYQEILEECKEDEQEYRQQNVQQNEESGHIINCHDDMCDCDIYSECSCQEEQPLEQQKQQDFDIMNMFRNNVQEEPDYYEEIDSENDNQNEIVEQPQQSNNQLENILNQVESSNNDIQIEAFAGCGKSYTLRKIAEKLENQNSLYLVFNKKNQEEAQQYKEFQNCDVMTFNGLGSKTLKNKQFNMNKLNSILQKNNDYQYIPFDYKKIIKKSISICKQYDILNINQQSNIDPIQFAMKSLFTDTNRITQQNNYQQNINKSLIIIQKALEQSISSNQIDFEDQLYLLTQSDCKLLKYDVILVDETQDLNQCQINIIKKFKEQQNSRIIYVGDQFQSIYQFRGSTGQSMKIMKQILEKFNKVTVCPLTINYRCDQMIVEYLKETIPYRYESFSTISKNQGNVIQKSPDHININQSNIAILAQTNNKCINYVSSMIQDNIIVKYDLKPILSNLLGQKFKNDMSVNDILNIDTDKSYSSIVEEEDIIDGKYIKELLRQFRDKSIQYVIDYLSNPKGIQVMTIHKSKGLEFDNVYLDFHYDQRTEQEQNLYYVGITRAKHNLYNIQQTIDN